MVLRVFKATNHAEDLATRMSEHASPRALPSEMIEIHLASRTCVTASPTDRLSQHQSNKHEDRSHKISGLQPVK